MNGISGDSQLCSRIKRVGVGLCRRNQPFHTGEHSASQIRYSLFTANHLSFLISNSSESVIGPYIPRPEIPLEFHERADNEAQRMRTRAADQYV